MKLQRLIPNLLHPSLLTHPRADLQAALSGALASIPQTLAYGMILGAALGGEFSGIGVLAALYGSVLVGLVAVLFGGCPFLVAGPRAATMLVFAALIVELKQLPAVAGLAQPTLTAFSLACAAASMAGLMQILFGAARFGRLASYVPLPVVAGFINGSALLIVFSQIWPATGVPRQASLFDLGRHVADIQLGNLCLATATVALIFVFQRSIRRGPVALWAILAANLLYLAGAALGFGPALGGTLPAPPEDVGLRPILGDAWTLLSGPEGESLVLRMIPAVVSMAILSTLDTLLATSAVDEATLHRSQAGRQLVAEGAANLVGPLFSMAPGSGSMMRTQAALSGGMVSAATPIGIAVLTLVITVVLSPAIGLLSQAVMAGLLIVLGIELFDKWTLARCRSLMAEPGARLVAVGDILTMAVVVAVTLAANLATAVAVGMGVALLSFVLQMARSPVRRCYRATALLPRLHGDQARRRFIEDHGREIAIIEMEGALFFGSATALKEQAEDLIAAGVVHIALDLKRVREVDATGARTLERLNQRLVRCGGLLTLGYVHRERRLSRVNLFGRPKSGHDFEPRHVWLKLTYLGTVRAIGEGRFFDDIDAAVGCCESHLARTLPARPDSREHWLRSPILQGIGPHLRGRLRPYLRRLSFAPGETVFAQGGSPDAAYLLTHGRVDVVLDLPGTERKLKVQSLTAGSVFGEMALIASQPRSASVVAQEATTCYALSTDALVRLKTEESEIAFALLANIAVIFAERLRATNSMLAEIDA